MKSNQSLHVTIKQPPSDKPVRSLGIFSDMPVKALTSIIENLLSEVPAEPKDAEFLQNVREEVIKVVMASTVETVVRRDGLLIITLREKTN